MSFRLPSIIELYENLILYHVLFLLLLLQANGNRLDRNVGNVLKDQDVTFSFRPKDKNAEVKKMPFQVKC